jgi:pilus assembly protein CpaF
VIALDNDLLDRVRTRFAADRLEAGRGDARMPASVAAAVQAEGRVLGDGALLEIVSAVSAELDALGPLRPLLVDPAVTDVLVHGADQVWVDRGSGLERTDVRVRDETTLRRLAQRLVATAGRRLDDAAPFADVHLADGLRLHAILAPVARSGTCLSLRVGRRRAFSLDELVEAGTLPRQGALLVRRIVERRLSLLVTGGTGCGKTTVLATLLGMVDARERIVVVEDNAELQPRHPHVVRLESRPANIEGAGALGLTELVRQALRMRPDRLVVGEVRGAEVVDLLAALNTGHEGGFGTVHANSAADVPARLEALALAAGLGRLALHSQLRAGVQAVLHLVRDADGRRRMSDIAIPRLDADGVVTMATAMAFARNGTIAYGPGADLLRTALREPA